MHDSPKRSQIPLEYFTTPKYQSVFPMASNGTPILGYISQDPSKRSTLPPGLDMVGEPSLLKSLVRCFNSEHQHRST